ncbi:hypothetical protein [Pseudomonas extremaustralis]|uniref:hypothetical protein n=1 Tax=Pseudomonas extremaustralis TaxID=359110 RepID=UPI002AA85D39|nr:hypothetical protein [Pseudomonas extremaustralis]
MKLSNQPFLPHLASTAQPQTPGTSAVLIKGNGASVQEHSNTEHGSQRARMFSPEYPMASDQDIHIRDTRALRRASPPKPPKPQAAKPTAQSRPTPRPVPKPAIKPTPQGAATGTRAATSSAKAISDLHNKHAFAPLSSELAASARSSFVSSATSNLINIPFSVGQHMVSKAILERIDAQAKMPGAEKKNADGTTTSVDPSATQQQKIEARLTDNEIKVELMTNTILSINEGPNAQAVGKRPDAPTDTNGRLTGLETTMTAVEAQMKDAGKRYGLIYTPYVAPTSADVPSAESRLDEIEKRHAHMNKMLKRLVRNAEADTEDA